ncbi:DUF3768 domain-containing protein [Sphingobium chungangianum]
MTVPDPATDRSSSLTGIRQLNDRCRQGRDPSARILITANCLATFAPGEGIESELVAQARLMAAVNSFTFAEDDRSERDFGEVLVDGRRVWFKIDYYDPALEFGSENPADASITRRVLTIMLPEDY